MLLYCPSSSYEKSKVKILLITYYYEPYVGAHAYRWTQIAKVWAAAGHDVDVIAGRTEDCTREVREGVNIERVGIIRRQSNEKPIVSENPLRKQRIGFAKLIGELKKIYRFFFWPDGLWHWLPFLLVSLYRRRKNNYDLVISYSPTFSAHIGGLFFKKNSKTSVAWIADYGDPFSTSETMQPNNFKLYRRLNNWIEYLVIFSASYVTVTNQSTRSEYLKRFAVGLNKIKCVPHAVDISDFYCESRNVSGLKKFVYVGAFHKGIREPYEMLRFFDEVYRKSRADFELHIYGPLNSCTIDFSRYSNIFYHGVVARDKAIAVMKEADVLVNVENENCSMTPSKLVEYIATGKPIVNFAGADGCSELLHKYYRSGYLFVLNGAEDVVKFFEFIEYVHSSNSLHDVREFLLDYDINVISSVFLSMCSSHND